MLRLAPGPARRASRYPCASLSHSVSHWFPHPLRALFTVVLAWLAAQLCVWLGTPIPWMMGPLLATALVSVLGAPTVSWLALRNGGQWVIGAALGLYFTPQVGQWIVGLWWAIALGIAWALWLGLSFGRWLHRRHAADLGGGDSPEALARWRCTTYFAGAIGGASEMTLIAERHGARTDLVASAHSLRVTLVTVTLPFVVQWWGVKGLDPAGGVIAPVLPAGLAWLALWTGLGALVMHRLGRANPWFMGALLVTMGISLSGVTLSALPKPLTEWAQLFIGVSLGVRFRPAFVQAAPRWLASVAMASFTMMALCAGFAWVMAQLTNVPLATMVLGTAPGGIAEMAITAKVLALGVPIVTAFQVCRLVAVLVLAEPVYRWWVLRPCARPPT